MCGTQDDVIILEHIFLFGLSETIKNGKRFYET